MCPGAFSSRVVRTEKNRKAVKSRTKSFIEADDPSLLILDIEVRSNEFRYLADGGVCRAM